MAPMGLRVPSPVVRLQNSLTLLASIVNRFLFGRVWRTLLLLLLVVLIPEIVIEIDHYRSAFDEQRAQALQVNLEVSSAVANTFDAYVQDILHEELGVGLAITSGQPLSEQQIDRLLSAVAKEYPSIRNYGWIDPQGRIVASSDPSVIGLDISDRPYFLEVVQGKEWSVSDLFVGRASGEISFFITRGIRDERGTLQGVLGAAIDPQRLGPILAAEGGGQSSIGLIDRQGRVVYRYPEVSLSWDQRDLMQTQPFIASALAGEQVSGTFATIPDGVRRIAAYVPDISTGWVIGAGRPEDEVMSPVYGSLLSEFTLKLLATLGAIVVAMVIGRKLTVPLRRVRDRALALGRGEAVVPVQAAGPGDIGDLANAFNRMAGEIESRQEVLQRYQLLSGHARDIILFIRRDGRIIEANDSAVRAYGYDREELLSMTVRELRDPISVPRIISWEEGSGSVLFEAVDRRKDGSTFPMEVASQGAILGEERVFLSIARDITERKQAEEQLADRARLAALGADVGVALTHGETLRESLQQCAEAMVKNLDAAFARIWTLNEEENVLELQASAGMYTHTNGPHGRVAVGQTMIGRIAVERQHQLFSVATRPSAFSDPEWARREGIIAFAGYPLIVEDRVVGVMAMFARHTLTDFTIKALASVADEVSLGIERDRVQRALKLRSDLLDAATDSVFLHDSDMKIWYMNEAAYRSRGYTKEELLAIGLRPLIPPEHVKGRFWEMNEQGQLTFESEHICKDGSRMSVEVHGRAIDVDGTRLILAVIRDITERKRLEKFQKQYVYTICHDLRNPLTAVQGLAQLLLRNAEKSGPGGGDLRTVQAIVSSAERMNGIIKDLLDSARLEAGQVKLEKEPVYLESFVTDLLERSGKVLSERQIRIDIPAGLPVVSADPNRLERVLMNLLTNAVKYSPPGNCSDLG